MTERFAQQTAPLLRLRHPSALECKENGFIGSSQKETPRLDVKDLLKETRGRGRGAAGGGRRAAGVTPLMKKEEKGCGRQSGSLWQILRILWPSQWEVLEPKSPSRGVPCQRVPHFSGSG